MIIPIASIQSEQDVKTFFTYLTQELGVNFHPDDSFSEYVDYYTGEQSFDDLEVETLDRLMEECFIVVERETGSYDGVYEIGVRVLFEAMCCDGSPILISKS